MRYNDKYSIDSISRGLKYSLHGTGHFVGNITNDIESYIDVAFRCQPMNEWDDEIIVNISGLAGKKLYLYLMAFVYDREVTHDIKATLYYLDEQGVPLLTINDIAPLVDINTNTFDFTDIPTNTAAIKVIFDKIFANSILSYVAVYE